MTYDTPANVESSIPVDSGAEAFVEMLNANDVQYLFLNSGTDTFPIQEAMAKFVAQGKTVPKAILCPDEATAIAASHGYFMVSRKPQVTLVHVDAGTLQLGGGLHNAQRGTCRHGAMRRPGATDLRGRDGGQPLPEHPLDSGADRPGGNGP